MGKLFADLELVLDLLDEADVLGVDPLDVLERELPPGARVPHAVDDALGTLSENIDDVIVEKFFGHGTSFHLGTALRRPGRWNLAGLPGSGGAADDSTRDRMMDRHARDHEDTKSRLRPIRSPYSARPPGRP